MEQPLRSRGGGEASHLLLSACTSLSVTAKRSARSRQVSVGSLLSPVPKRPPPPRARRPRHAAAGHRSAAWCVWRPHTPPQRPPRALNSSLAARGCGSDGMLRSSASTPQTSFSQPVRSTSVTLWNFNSILPAVAASESRGCSRGSSATRMLLHVEHTARHTAGSSSWCRNSCGSSEPPQAHPRGARHHHNVRLRRCALDRPQPVYKCCHARRGRELYSGLDPRRRRRRVGYTMMRRDERLGVGRG